MGYFGRGYFDKKKKEWNILRVQRAPSGFRDVHTVLMHGCDMNNSRFNQVLVKSIYDLHRKIKT